MLIQPFLFVYSLVILFIEILDKLIPYIVWIYRTWYQVSPVEWTWPNHYLSLSRLIVILVHATGLNWYKVLYQLTMYVMGIYIQLLQRTV